MCKMTSDTNGETDQEEMHERLTALLEHATNRVCADCPERNPGLISLLQKPLVENGSNLGVFCCSKCSRAHRKLGEKVVVVKRVYDDFDLNEIEALEQSGNQFVNNILEANATEADKSEDREVFVRKKYKEIAFFSEDKLYQESAVRAKANKYAMLLVKPAAAPSRADRLLKRPGSDSNLIAVEDGLTRASSSRNLMGNRANSSRNLKGNRAGSSRNLLGNRTGSSRDLMGNAEWGFRAGSKGNLLATDGYRRSSMPMNSTVDSDDTGDDGRPVERKQSSAFSPKRQRPPRSSTEGGNSSDGMLQRMAMGRAGSRRDLTAGQRASSRRNIVGTKSSGDSSEGVLQRMAMGRAGSRRDLMADHRASSKRDVLANERRSSKRDLLNSGKSLSKRDLQSSRISSSSPSLTSLARPSGSKWGMVKSNLLHQASRNSLLAAYQDTDSESEDESKLPSETGKATSPKRENEDYKKERTRSTSPKRSSKWGLVKSSLLDSQKRSSLLLNYASNSDDESEEETQRSPSKEAPREKTSSKSRRGLKGDLSRGSAHLSRTVSKGDLAKGSQHSSKGELSKGSQHSPRSASKGDVSKDSKYLSVSSSNGALSKGSTHRSKPSFNEESTSSNLKEYKDDASSPRSPLDVDLANQESKALEGQLLTSKPISKKDRLKAITDKPENTLCSECTNKNPTWASFFKSPVDDKKLGVLCCYFCYGLHHTVGEGEMTLKNLGAVEQWSEGDFEALEQSGNTSINAAYEATVGNGKKTDFDHDRGREAFFFEKYINLRYFSGEVYQQLSAKAEAKSLAAKMENLRQAQQQQQQQQQQHQQQEHQERRANRRSSNDHDRNRSKKRSNKQDDEKKRQAILELKAARKSLEGQQAREAQEEKHEKKALSNTRLGKLDRLESQEKSTTSRLDKCDRPEKIEKSTRKSSSRRSLFDDDRDGEKSGRKTEKKDIFFRKSSSRRSLFDDDGDEDMSARKPELKEKSMRKLSSKRSIVDEDCEDDKSVRKSSSRRDLLQKQESRRLKRRGSSRRNLMEDSSTDETDKKPSSKDERNRSAKKSLRKSSSGRDLSRSSSRRDLL